MNPAAADHSATAGFLDRAPRKAWGGAKSNPEARADISKIHRSALKMGGQLIHSCFQKSPVGPTLREIKSDARYLPRLADAMAELVQITVPIYDPVTWRVVCAPPRRHPENNFGVALCREVAARIGVKVHTDFAVAPKLVRVGAVFDVDRMPEAPNLIVIDDVLTTGSTMESMGNLCRECGRNAIFFTAICNR